MLTHLDAQGRAQMVDVSAKPDSERIAIARAFLKDAPIVLLDEPTSALDAETESRLMHTLESLMANRTVIIVGHRLSTIRGAENILVLSHGEIIESGSHNDLLAQGERYSLLWKSQTSGSERDKVFF